jgi:hypothetical protein
MGRFLSGGRNNTQSQCERDRINTSEMLHGQISSMQGESFIITMNTASSEESVIDR